jgi:tubulin polyglutamylase TTLL2
VVTSVHPLEIYLYRDGLVRFGTEKYQDPHGSDLNNLYSHLTNR